MPVLLFSQGQSEVCFVILYESYVTKKYHKSCQRLRRKYPGIPVPASSTIVKLVRKVIWTGSFLGKKYTRQSAVLHEVV
jgi:hypothetical protein